MVVIIATVASVVVLLGAAVVLLVFLKKHSSDRKAEQLYSVYIEDVLSKNNLLRQCAPKVPKRIIVDSQGDTSSAFRTMLLKGWYKLRKIDVREDPVLIFGKNSDEQKACLIRLTVELPMVEITTLDTDYRNTIINYEAYKYAHHSPHAPKGTTLILKQEWENSTKREHITKLDDPDFSEKIVINPPPQKRSILERVVYPLIVAKSRSLVGVSNFHTHERACTLTTKVIRCLAEQTMGIIFIGLLSPQDYIDMVGNKIFLFKDGFVVTGLGSQMPRVEYISNKLRSVSEELWNLRLEYESTQGRWTFSKWEVEFLFTIMQPIQLAD